MARRAGRPVEPGGDASMQQILIVYGTRYGQTARIARHIHRALIDRHFDVAIHRGDTLPVDFHLARYDGIVVGASMIGGHYQKYIGRFVRRHAPELDQRPTAFFAVSGGAGSANTLERQEAERRMRAFCFENGWHPALALSVAGAMAYTKYNFLVRWAMKRISRKEGGSTDTTRDHEYTNWAEVEEFADRFADRMEQAAVGSATAPSVPQPHPV
jgi:menaquinone-dependent protoporphyrinogen oxidase